MGEVFGERIVTCGEVYEDGEGVVEGRRGEKEFEEEGS